MNFGKLLAYLIGNFAFFAIFCNIIQLFTNNKIIILISSLVGLLVWNITCIMDFIDKLKTQKESESINEKPE